MGHARRRLLGRSRPTHYPENKRPHLIVRRNGEEWGIAMLHGGLELYWWPAAEAQLEGLRLIDLARLAANPGSLPAEDCG